MTFTHEIQRGNIIRKRSNQVMTSKETMRRFNAAFDSMANGLSQDDLAEMIAAMIGVRTIDEVREMRALKTNAAARRGNHEHISRRVCADIRRYMSWCTRCLD